MKKGILVLAVLIGLLGTSSVSKACYTPNDCYGALGNQATAEAAALVACSPPANLIPGVCPLALAAVLFYYLQAQNICSNQCG
jgi:hypothetical protein